MQNDKKISFTVFIDNVLCRLSPLKITRLQYNFHYFITFFLQLQEYFS